MIMIKKDELCICMTHPNPKELKSDLIIFFSQAIQWRISFQEHQQDDGYSLYVLSLLLAEFADVKE